MDNAQSPADLLKAYLHYVGSSGFIFMWWRREFPDIVVDFELTIEYAHVFI
ncbi:MULTISPECIES: hypothetical protein [Nocardia]|uniref:hypothetical protein n=1 Tax=Nocardia TaxID=1817 RepID=UPI0013001CFC|nr:MULTISPECIES: hypothetical protein [Nocardia]